MAAFGGTFTATQDSVNPKTITFTDERNWGDNDSFYESEDFVRTLVLTDAEDEVLDTIIFPPTEDTVTYEIEENTNPWINAVLTTTGTPDLPTLTKKFPFQRYFDLAYIAVKVKDCGCCGGNNTDMCMVNSFLNNAKYAELQGDGVAYQSNIDAGYTLLT